MKKTIKAWTALGAVMTAGSAMAAPVETPNLDTRVNQSAHILLAALEDGAGGEGGGEAGSGLTNYSLLSTDPGLYEYDASAQIDAYVDLVQTQYGEAVSAAKLMADAIAQFLDAPNEANLAAARAAWVAARPAYIRTEVYRFYDGPIEDVEGRINAWPLNEAAIDYVKGNDDAGLINDLSLPITLDSINGADQVADEADVTTGWHAIEFLLWGQDFNADGPGQRAATDFEPGVAHNDRRRDYLSLVTGQLVGDLETVLDQWDAANPNAYAANFRKLPQREALGRVMNGMAILVGSEFLSARLTVGLDSGDQEDEHSCFSDTTHQDFVADLDGAVQVWTGGSGYPDRAGIGALVRTRDPELADKVDALFADAVAKVAVLGDPWDRVLASPPDSPARADAEEAITALEDLTSGLVSAGGKLGVLVLVPSS